MLHYYGVRQLQPQRTGHKHNMAAPRSKKATMTTLPYSFSKWRKQSHHDHIAILLQQVAETKKATMTTLPYSFSKWRKQRKPPWPHCHTPSVSGRNKESHHDHIAILLQQVAETKKATMTTLPYSFSKWQKQRKPPWPHCHTPSASGGNKESHHDHIAILLQQVAETKQQLKQTLILKSSDHHFLFFKADIQDHWCENDSKSPSLSKWLVWPGTFNFLPVSLGL